MATIKQFNAIERIGQALKGFQGGIDNYNQSTQAANATQMQANSTLSNALQIEAQRRQQAMEMDLKLTEATGRNFVGSGIGQRLVNGENIGGIEEALKSLPTTPKFEREQETLKLDREYKQSQIDKNKAYNPTAKRDEERNYKDNLRKDQAIDSLRKEISTLSKPMFEIDTALSKINSAPETAAGDITRVFSFMKLNDPNSTVREGEYATAQNAAGVPERIRAAYNNALSGTVLTPSQRADFRDAAIKLARSQYETFGSQITPHKNRIKSMGLDESQILPQFSQQSLLVNQPQQPPATQELKLPTGQTFTVKPLDSDPAAVEWAKKNPGNPKAAIILQANGVQ